MQKKILLPKVFRQSLEQHANVQSPLEACAILFGTSNDKTWETTDEAKLELISKLNTVLSCDYEVVGQLAGIRPTVKDRRPLVGRHPEYKNMYVLNGLGTRGVMVAPTVSDQLLDYIEYKTVLDTEIDIQRFADEYIAS